MAELQIIVVGAGGHGSELYSYIRDLAAIDPGIRLAGFIDEGKSRGAWSDTCILGNFRDLRDFVAAHAGSSFRYITAVGDNELRQAFVEKVSRAANVEPWSLIHPRSMQGFDVSIGRGTCLAPGSVVTTRVRVGNHCILNVNSSLSHDCVVGNFVNINPGAVIAGGVHIGEGCFIGAGSTIIENVSIGEWAVIGAGAVVIDDIPPYSTAVGVPAKVIKQRQLRRQRLG